ncbi:MAG: MOSC domain-containing protein [Solirubrobacteraceae bacterium]
MDAHVTRLLTTPIKGIRVNDVPSIMINRSGAAGDRRFFLVDDRDRMVNAKPLGMLQTVSGSFDEHCALLSLVMPNGVKVEAPVQFDTSMPEQPYGHFRAGRVVRGPWAEALSELAQRRLRLVMTASAVDRGSRGAFSLLSRASLRRLAERAAVNEVDARRFRMLIEVDGVDAHAEDGWVGRELSIGPVLLRVEGHVGRCLVTSRDPETGQITMPTLELLRSYRPAEGVTEPLPLGIHGRVLQGGVISLGDPVEVMG